MVLSKRELRLGGVSFIIECWDLDRDKGGSNPYSLEGSIKRLALQGKNFEFKRLIEYFAVLSDIDPNTA